MTNWCALAMRFKPDWMLALHLASTCIRKGTVTGPLTAICVCVCPEAVRLVELLGHILPEGVARTFPEESKNSKNTSKVSSRQRSLRFEHPLASRTHAPAQTIVGITLGSLCRETDRQLQNTGMHGTLTYHMNHRQLKQTCLSMLTSVCSPSA